MKKMKDAMKDVLVLLISVAMIFTMGNPLPFAFSDDEKNPTTGMPNLQIEQTPIVNPLLNDPLGTKQNQSVQIPDLDSENISQVSQRSDLEH